MDHFTETLNGPRVDAPNLHVFQLPDGVWVAKARDLPPKVSEAVKRFVSELNAITS